MERKNRVILITCAAATVFFDQLIKSYIRNLPYGKALLEIPGIVQVTHYVNTGAAFSIMSGQAKLLIALSSLLLAGICGYVFLRMQMTGYASAAVGCLIGGGFGNLFDRIAFQGVTDYIRLLFFDFPVFNLADIAITGATACLIILLFLGKLEGSTGEDDGSNH